MTKQSETEILEVAKSLLNWIDSVPSDVPLPAMPGVDRDWVDSVICDYQSYISLKPKGNAQ